MKFKTLLLSSMLMAVPAFGADIDGNWTGAIDTPNGPMQVDYTFKADGAALTGTTKGPDGAPIAIKNGKIDGAKVSFSLDLDFGGQVTTLNYTGALAGDSLSLATDFMGQAMSFTLKKAK